MTNVVVVQVLMNVVFVVAQVQFMIVAVMTSLMGVHLTQAQYLKIH
jgi:hypothetical protein